MDEIVSIVVLSYNRINHLKELLPKLHQQEWNSLEIVLVDNGSSDGTVDSVRRKWPKVRCIVNDHNVGMVAYNLGFEAARGKYILVMDDDGLPADDQWVRRIVQCFESNPILAVVCCTIRMRDSGLIAHDSPQFVPEGEQAYGFPAIAYNGTGAALRSSALAEVGYYPWHYITTYLELHLCLRLIQAGWEVRHFPDIEVWHSRLSGSSHPAQSKLGLRNYAWLVTEFYPWRYLLHEFLHEVGYRTKLVIRGNLSLRLLITTAIDSFRGLPTIIKNRTPISKETLEYMRNVRKNGNWHGFVPEQSIFGDIETMEHTGI